MMRTFVYSSEDKVDATDKSEEPLPKLSRTIAWMLNIMAMALLLFGVDLRINFSDKKPGSLFQIVLKFVRLVQFLLILVEALFAFHLLVSNMQVYGFQDGILAVVIFSLFLTNIIVYFYVMLNSAMISSIFKEIVIKVGQRLSQHWNDFGRRHFKYIQIWVAFFLCVWALSLMAVGGYTVEGVIYGNELNTTGLICDVDKGFLVAQLGCPVLETIYSIGTSWLLLSISLFMIALIAIFLTAIILVYFHFRLLDAFNLEDWNKSASTKLLLRLHDQSCQLLAGISSVFSFLMFIWLGLEIFICICLIRSWAVGLYKDISFSFYICFLIGFLFFDVIVKLLLSAYANEQVFKSFERIKLHEITVDPMSTKLLPHRAIADANLQLDIQLYFEQLNMHPPFITVWGCFEINKNLIMGVLGTTLSYTLLILRL